MAKEAGYKFDQGFQHAGAVDFNDRDTKEADRNEWQRGYQFDIDVETGLLPWDRKTYKFVNGPEAPGYRESTARGPTTWVRKIPTGQEAELGTVMYEMGDGRAEGRTTYVRKYGPDGKAVKGPDGKLEYEEWSGPEYDYKPDVDSVGCFPKETYFLAGDVERIEAERNPRWPWQTKKTYTVVTGSTATQRTVAPNDTTNPVWKEDKYFTVPKQTGDEDIGELWLVCKLFDDDSWSKPDFMGGFEVKLDDIPRNKPVKMTFDLQSDDPNADPSDPAHGTKWGVVLTNAAHPGLGEKSLKKTHVTRSVKATGQVDLLLQFAHVEENGVYVKPSPPLPIKPMALLAMIPPALIWVIVFLISTIAHGMITLMDIASSAALMYALKYLFGWKIRCRHLSLRPNLSHMFFGAKGFSEIVLHDLELENPPG